MADFDPTHPGEVLLEDFMKPLGLTQYALAKALSVTQVRIGEIVHGKRAISPDTALRLSRYSGPVRNSGWACRQPTIWK